MGAIKTFFGLSSLAALGFVAFEASRIVPYAIHTYRSVQTQTGPHIRTITWSPGKAFPSTRGSSSGSGGSKPTSPLLTTRPGSTVNANSLNWAGIVQAGSSEKSIQASWKVPTFSRMASADSAVAEWIGLGGMQSDPLIQVGTITSPSQTGQATTTVFWEELPHSAVQSATVPSGAEIDAKIEPVAHDQWRLWLKVQGQSKPLINHVITLTPQQAQAIQSSADWITEAPTTNNGLAPLAPVSSTTMTHVEANGVPLAKMNPNTLESVGLYSQRGQLLAEPTRNTSKDSITVNTIYGSTPSQPSGNAGSAPEVGPGYSPYAPGGGNPYGGYGYGRGFDGNGRGGDWSTVRPGYGTRLGGSPGGVTWVITY